MFQAEREPPCEEASGTAKRASYAPLWSRPSVPEVFSEPLPLRKAMRFNEVETKVDQ